MWFFYSQNIYFFLRKILRWNGELCMEYSYCAIIVHILFCLRVFRESHQSLWIIANAQWKCSYKKPSNENIIKFSHSDIVYVHFSPLIKFIRFFTTDFAAFLSRSIRHLTRSDTNFLSKNIELHLFDFFQSISKSIKPYLRLTPYSPKVNNPFSWK